MRARIFSVGHMSAFLGACSLLGTDPKAETSLNSIKSNSPGPYCHTMFLFTAGDITLSLSIISAYFLPVQCSVELYLVIMDKSYRSKKN